MITAVASKIEKISPKVRHISQIVANASPEHDADDIFQESVLWLLEQAEKDPSIVEQTDAYVIWGATTTGGKHAARASRTYTRYVQAEPRVENDDEDEDIEWIETLADSSNDPEARFIENEEISALASAIAQLTPANQKLVTMLYNGFNQNEIADALGISKGAVSQRKATVERQLAELLF